MNNSAAHSKLVDEIILAVGSHPRIRAWKRPVGFDRTMGIMYGQPGEPDIEFVIAPHGRMGGIEVKTGSGVLSANQLKRHAMLAKFGVALITARSVKEAVDGIEKFL